MSDTSNHLPRDDDGKLSKWAWPGGYPIYYLDKDNSTLCPTCANKSDSDDELLNFRPIAAGINYEDAYLFCDDCGERIESAYREEKREDD